MMSIPSQPNLPPRLVLIGMKHCGKSTVGRAVAERLQCAFYDTDDLLVALHGQRTGRQMTVPEIFRQLGADGFAELERAVVCDLAARCSDSTPWVIALGGRTPTYEDCVAAIRRLGLVIYLRADADTLYGRVANRAEGLPSFLDPERPREHFSELLAEREPHYLKLADVVLDIGNSSVDEVTGVVCRQIQRS